MESSTGWIPVEKTQNSYITGLHVKNSLHADQLKQTEFIPISGRDVKWYMCGPTVYDMSHLGHARTYISFDIIKRVMRDYFGYNVQLCMNITDIDDKIIKRSNERSQEFKELTKQYEKAFLEDMRSLNVELPEIMIRVSESVPQIIQFIEKIIQNGFAYESNGSVYLDVNKYREKHMYPKLEPTNFNNKELLEEGEGVLTEANVTSEKRSPNDFVLWKKSKPQEPTWSSPWGEGRPGWHIECSAMIHNAFAGIPTIDLHSGGVDLKFPHHDNEIAQSEAFYDNKQWINFFIHSGHLNINGLKMAKSLKNFLTIRDILEHELTPRQMRLMFALHRYDGLMNFDPKTSLDEARDKDKYFKEFILNARALLRQIDLIQGDQTWSKEDSDFNDLIQKAKEAVDKNLKNNFNFPGTLLEIQKLILAINKYSTGTAWKYLLVKQAYDFIVKILQTMGFQYEIDESESRKESLVTSYLDSVAQFRDKIRTAGRAKDIAAVLAICDDYRDNVLPFLGIRLEDKAVGQPSVWKLDSVDTLLKERQEKINLKDAKEKEKEERRKKEEELAQIKPEEMFRNDPAYEGFQFDEKGIPTLNKAGEPVQKKLVAKLVKDWEKQKKLHEDYLAKKTA